MDTDDGGDRIDEDTAANIAALLDEAPHPAGERKRFLGWLGVPAVSEIPASRARAAMKALVDKRARGWK